MCDYHGLGQLIWNFSGAVSKRLYYPVNRMPKGLDEYDDQKYGLIDKSSDKYSNQYQLDLETCNKYFLAYGQKLIIKIQKKPDTDSLGAIMKKIDDQLKEMNNIKTYKRQYYAHIYGIYYVKGLNETYCQFEMDRADPIKAFESNNAQFDKSSCIQPADGVIDYDFAMAFLGVVGTLPRSYDGAVIDFSTWANEIKTNISNFDTNDDELYTQQIIPDATFSQSTPGSYLYSPQYLPLSAILKVKYSEYYIAKLRKWTQLPLYTDSECGEFMNHIPALGGLISKITNKELQFYEKKYDMTLPKQEGKLLKSISDLDNATDIFGNNYKNLAQYANFSENIKAQWYDQYKNYSAVDNFTDILNTGALTIGQCFLDQYYTKIGTTLQGDYPFIFDHQKSTNPQEQPSPIVFENFGSIDFKKPIDSLHKFTFGEYENLASRGRYIHSEYIYCGDSTQVNGYYFHLPATTNVKYMHLFTFGRVKQHITMLRQFLEMDDIDHTAIIILCMQEGSHKHKHIYVKINLSEVKQADRYNEHFYDSKERITIRNIVEQQWGFKPTDDLLSIVEKYPSA